MNQPRSKLKSANVSVNYSAEETSGFKGESGLVLHVRSLRKSFLVFINPGMISKYQSVSPDKEGLTKLRLKFYQNGIQS